MDLEAQEIRKWVSELNEEAILWDGLDECIIGVSTDGKAVYDIQKMIAHFQTEGMSREEAEEWVDYNILYAYVGELTPIHIYTHQ